MTKLPESKEGKKLSDLKFGESCYTTPWAMWVNSEGVCFLNEDYTAHSSKAGTVEMKVERVEDGYVVYIHDLNYKWQKSKNHGFMSDDSVCYGKVVSFGIDSYESLTKDELINEMKKASDGGQYEKAAEIRDYIAKKFPSD